MSEEQEHIPEPFKIINEGEEPHRSRCQGTSHDYRQINQIKSSEPLFFICSNCGQTISVLKPKIIQLENPVPGEKTKISIAP